MTNTILCDNLKQLMKFHGSLTVSELSRLTSIPQPTIHHILNGITKNPRQKALQNLAQFFSITVSQLLGKEQIPYSIPKLIKESLQINSIPLIDWDQLSSWPYQKNEASFKKEILIDKKISANSFALVNRKETKSPIFQENTLLIFDSDKPPQDRDFVVVHFSQDDRIEFNRIFVEEKVFYLLNDLGNENLNLKKLNFSVDRILGVLTEARIQY